MSKFMHVYLKTVKTRYDSKGRPYEQYRESQSFYDEFESKMTGDGWLIVKSDGSTFWFPVESISEIVEGDS